MDHLQIVCQQDSNEPLAPVWKPLDYVSEGPSFSSLFFVFFLHCVTLRKKHTKNQLVYLKIENIRFLN